MRSGARLLPIITNNADRKTTCGTLLLASGSLPRGPAAAKRREMRGAAWPGTGPWEQSKLIFQEPCSLSTTLQFVADDEPAGLQNPPRSSTLLLRQSSEFVSTQLRMQLDQVSAAVNGKSTYVYCVSPAEINVLTPPNAMSGSVQVALPPEI
jgi:hypothetical protein